MSPGLKIPAFTCFDQVDVSKQTTFKHERTRRHRCKQYFTFGWRETLVMSWSSTNVQVMKKMLMRQDGSGEYHMYISMIPTKLTTYAVVAISIVWIWLQREPKFKLATKSSDEYWIWLAFASVSQKPNIESADKTSPYDYHVVHQRSTYNSWKVLPSFWFWRLTAIVHPCNETDYAY